MRKVEVLLSPQDEARIKLIAEYLNIDVREESFFTATDIVIGWALVYTVNSLKQGGEIKC